MQGLADSVEKVSQGSGGDGRADFAAAVLSNAYESEDLDIVLVPGDCKLRERSECKSLVTGKSRSCPPEIEL